MLLVLTSLLALLLLDDADGQKKKGAKKPIAFQRKYGEGDITYRIEWCGKIDLCQLERLLSGGMVGVHNGHRLSEAGK